MNDWVNLLLTAISTGANVALLILSLKGKKKNRSEALQTAEAVEKGERGASPEYPLPISFYSTTMKKATIILLILNTVGIISAQFISGVASTIILTAAACCSIVALILERNRV